MIIFTIKGMLYIELRDFIIQSHAWCNENFGPRTNSRKLFDVGGRWANEPVQFATASGIFCFQNMADAMLFKMVFGTYLEEGYREEG